MKFRGLRRSPALLPAALAVAACVLTGRLAAQAGTEDALGMMSGCRLLQKAFMYTCISENLRMVAPETCICMSTRTGTDANNNINANVFCYSFVLYLFGSFQHRGMFKIATVVGDHPVNEDCRL